MFRKWLAQHEEAITGYVCALPWILGISLFIVGPMVASVIFSLMDYSMLLPSRFIGFDNYRNLLFHDLLAWKALYNTFYMTVFGVPLRLIFALILALLLNQNVKGITVFRTLFYVPTVVPQVATALLWMWILNPQMGIVNHLLGLVGVKGPMWLASEIWSKPALILMSLWGVGGNMVIYLAGLQNIPQHLYDAAAVDGANGWQRFWSITLPMLSPTIFFTFVMGIIGALQTFTEAYVMTQGGPMDSTLFYVYHLFNMAFRDFRMGYASALAWFLFLLVFAATVLNMRVSQQWVYYEVD